jgi:hypothetical protein
MTQIDSIITEVSPYYKSKKDPSAQHVLTYNSSAEAMEQIYFSILDFMNGIFGGNTEKLIDNFASSPGSGFYGEMSQRIGILQQNASNLMGTIAGMLKGIINLIYDLREFKIRLSHYDAANSNDKVQKESAMLALKQIWMDKVDIQRGNGSINAMTAGNLQFVTLRDSFMIVNSPEEVDKLDINERVQRILKPRIKEFLEWKKMSESELRKRFETEKLYLKSQVNNLKLNSRWAKPYLKAAQILRNNENLANNAQLVNIFNTILLELTIMGKSQFDVGGAVAAQDLPVSFKKLKDLRSYYSVVFVDFNFRGIPNRQQSGFVFPGRATVTFKGYALNQEEMDLLKNKLSESDLEDSFKMIEGMTDQSLDQMKLDLEEFMPDEKKEEKKSEGLDINPFSALFSFVTPPKKKEEKKPEEKIAELKKKGIRKDNYHESYIRNHSEAKAISLTYTVFDIYKKSHGMVSLPFTEPIDVKAPQNWAEKMFNFKS